MAVIQNIGTFSALPAYFLPPEKVQKRTSSPMPAYLHIAKNHQISSQDLIKKVSRSVTSSLNRKIHACATTSFVRGVPRPGSKRTHENAVTAQQDTQPLKSKNAQEFLETLIAFGRERSTEDGPSTKAPRVGSPQHFFKLIPEDPTLVSAMNSGRSANEWINQSIIQPGLKISALPLSESQKTSFINAIKSTFLIRELHGIFGEALKTLDPKINSVHDYSNALVEIIATIMPNQNNFLRTAIAKHVSSVLIESILPASVRKMLITSSTRIADTNWVDQNLKRIYVVCFFDPVTNALAVGTLNEEGYNLRFEDQSEWEMLEPSLAG